MFESVHFSHLHLKFALSAIMSYDTSKKIFRENYQYGYHKVKNAEFYAPKKVKNKKPRKKCEKTEILKKFA
jgi:hypothetical protein